MNSEEKEISYTTTNTYSTLNTLTPATKNVWLVCHGLGYLSKYFIKYFKALNPEQNYIIAPQAQSKYYLKSNFKHVGACWLTKEKTINETENVLNYIDAVLKNENVTPATNLIVLGFSQGVSIAARYVTSRQLQCKKLILHSGTVPKELTSSHFNFYKGETHLVYGNNDDYLTPERLKTALNHAKSIFKNQLNIIAFNGVHEIDTQTILKLSR